MVPCDSVLLLVSLQEPFTCTLAIFSVMPMQCVQKRPPAMLCGSLSPSRPRQRPPQSIVAKQPKPALETAHSFQSFCPVGGSPWNTLICSCVLRSQRFLSPVDLSSVQFMNLACKLQKSSISFSTSLANRIIPCVLVPALQRFHSNMASSGAPNSASEKVPASLAAGEGSKTITEGERHRISSHRILFSFLSCRLCNCALWISIRCILQPSPGAACCWAEIAFGSSIWLCAQVFNRDLTVLAIAQHAADREAAFTEASVKKELRRRASRAPGTPLAKVHAAREAKIAAGGAAAANSGKLPAAAGIEIIEALAATGLRSLRYSKEVPGVAGVVANDMSKLAVQSMRDNVVFNGLDPDIVFCHEGDAVELLRAHSHAAQRVDVVDLDPYGTASPFLEPAIGAVVDGGLLCITCTDMQTLAGGNLHTAWSRYNCFGIRSKACHELALRMLLNATAHAAARQKATITPLLSLSVDFYIRVFVRVNQKANAVHMAPAQLGFVRHCVTCGTHSLQPLAREAGRGKRGKGPVKLTAGVVTGDGVHSEGGEKLAIMQMAAPNSKKGPPKKDGAAAPTPATLEAAVGDTALPDGSADGGPCSYQHPSDNQRAVTASARCAHCEGMLVQGGPFWLGPLHDQGFVSRVLQRLEATGVEGAAHVAVSEAGAAATGATAAGAAAEGAAESEHVFVPRGAIYGSTASPLTSAAAGAGVSPAGVALGSMAGSVARGAGQDAGSNTVDTVAASRMRLAGTLAAMQAELPDVPVHWDLAQITSTVKTTAPKMGWFMGCLEAAGYRASPVHTSAQGIKTDAPAHVVWDVMRLWAESNPLSEWQGQRHSPGNAILAQTRTTTFPGFEPQSGGNAAAAASDASKQAAGSTKRLRKGMFRSAPRAGWGPKGRAVAGVGTSAESAGTPEPESKKARSGDE